MTNARINIFPYDLYIFIRLILHDMSYPFINNILTRLTTFIKAKHKKSDDQTNIVKYRVAESIT